MVRGEAYRMGQKSKLLILSEYVNKTEKLGGSNLNKYEHLQRKWSIVWYFHVKYFVTIALCLNILWLKAVNEITARQTKTSLYKHNVIKVCSTEYLTLHK